MASSGYFTNDAVRHRILSVYPQFISDVDSDRLSDYLVQGNVITIDQWQRIRLENPAKPDRCRALLSHLFSIQNPTTFLIVRQALSKENHYLLESIDSQEPVCGINVQSWKHTTLQDDTSGTKEDSKQNNQSTELQAAQHEIRNLKARILELENDLTLYRSVKAQHQKKEEVLEQRVNQLESELHSDKTKLRQRKSSFTERKKTWKKERDRLLKTIADLEAKLQLENPQNEYNSDPVLVQTIVTKAAKKKKPICSLAIINKEIFVVNKECSDVEVYDFLRLSFSRQWNLKELIEPRHIASCRRNKCLYIIDYKGQSHSKEILSIDPNGIILQKWSTGEDYGRLSVTNEDSSSVGNKSNVILTVRLKNKLIEYSPDGQLIREIILSLDTDIRFPVHAIKLTNGHFLVCHGRLLGDSLHRVCLVDTDGKLKKSFGGIHGTTTGQMFVACHLSVDRRGFVMVVDRMNSRVLLLDSDLNLKKEILSKEKHGLRYPQSVILDESNGRLFVADNRWSMEKSAFRDGQILIFYLND